MAEHSSIEWTDATWNPITGCSLVSPGCTNCYAMQLACTRLRHHPSRAGLTVDSKAGPVWNGKVHLNEEWLTQPIAWKRPRMIFVCAHGDLFHPDVPDAWIDRVFAVMALCPRHTFQVLTKRSARMRAYLSAPSLFARLADAIVIASDPAEPLAPHRTGIAWGDGGKPAWGVHRAVQGLVALVHPWPLPNVWLGVSAEDQTRAEERVPDLLATPAAVRFVSAEPLLGPIDFTSLGQDAMRFDEERQDALRGWVYDEDPQDGSAHGITPGYGRLDWIIVGGESGPKVRPMDPVWARSIRDQCAAAGTAFHFKQWGAWAPSDACPDAWPSEGMSGMIYNAFSFRNSLVHEVGKKRAGRLLDGVEHNGMPATR